MRKGVSNWQHDAVFHIDGDTDIHIKRRLKHGWELVYRVMDKGQPQNKKILKDTVQIGVNDEAGLKDFLTRNHLETLEGALRIRMLTMLTQGKEMYLRERGIRQRKR